MCIKDRLLFACKQLGIEKPKKFQEATGFPYRTAQSYLNGTRTPNAEGLVEICTRLRINLNWLIAGVGTPFIEEQDTKSELPEFTSGSLTPDEQSLLDDYRYSSETGKQAISTVAKAVEKQIQIEAGKVS